MNSLGKVAIQATVRSDTEPAQGYAYSRVAITSICRAAKVSPHTWTHDLPYTQQLVTLISSGIILVTRHKLNT